MINKLLVGLIASLFYARDGGKQCNSEVKQANYSRNSIICVYKLYSTAKQPQVEFFRLSINGSNSLFQSEKKIMKDSIYESYNKVPFSQEVFSQMNTAVSKISVPEFNYSVYKDGSKSELTYVDVVRPNKYSYKENCGVFQWKIVDSSAKVINGYACQKATTLFRGRRFEAWFTRQIPISEGPYKFCGLPGLIVKITDLKNAYDFELVKLTQSEQPVAIIFPNKVIATTREKYLAAVKDWDTNMIERAKLSGVTFSNPEEAKKMYKEKLSRRNNPLELE